jgi:hypothetical protein
MKHAQKNVQHKTNNAHFTRANYVFAFLFTYVVLFVFWISETGIKLRQLKEKAKLSSQERSLLGLLAKIKCSSQERHFVIRLVFCSQLYHLTPG